MSAETGGSVEIGSMTIESSNQSAEEILADLGQDAPEATEDDPSKAAAILGKKGGEAAAAKRAADAKEAAKNERVARKAAQADGDGRGDDADAAGADPEHAADSGETRPDDRSAQDRRKGNPKHDPTARVQQATREAAEARREAQAAREEAARYRAELDRRSKPAEEQPQPARKADGEPREEDFDNYVDFVKATARYEVQQERKAAAELDRFESQHREMAGRFGKFTEVMTQAADADPTFIERTQDFAKWCRPTETFAQDDPRRNHPRTWIADEVLHNPESAPALVLHLMEHVDEIQRIATLSRRADVIRELAKIVTRLESATTDNSPRPTVSKAKPPVKPVAGSPPTDSGEPDEDAPLSAFVQRWNQREQRASSR